MKQRYNHLGCLTGAIVQENGNSKDVILIKNGDEIALRKISYTDSILTVYTKDRSVFQIVILEPVRGKVIIWGSPLFRSPKVCIINGCTKECGGSEILFGKLKVGCYLEIVLDKNKIAYSKKITGIKISSDSYAVNSLIQQTLGETQSRFISAPKHGKNGIYLHLLDPAHTLVKVRSGSEIYKIAIINQRKGEVAVKGPPPFQNAQRCVIVGSAPVGLNVTAELKNWIGLKMSLVIARPDGSMPRTHIVETIYLQVNKREADELILEAEEYSDKKGRY